jgi:hypothetical protein
MPRLRRSSSRTCLLAALGALLASSAPGLSSARAAPQDGGARFGPWQKVREQDGVVVYARKVPGTPIREVRGTGLVHAPLLEILAVINDVDAYVQWMPKVKVSRVLARPSRTEVIGYSLMKAPWPVADRDTVVHASASFARERGEVTVQLRTVRWPALGPVRGVVRMIRFDGMFRLTRVSERLTRIDYQVLGDPAGNVPAWIANLVARRLPVKTIQRLRKRVRAVGGRYGAFVAAFRSWLWWPSGGGR